MISFLRAGIPITCILILFNGIVNAQYKEPYKQPTSDVVLLHSNILKEDRMIYIHYPKPDSLKKDKRYPVLYLLDGESHFEMLSQHTDYLSRWDVDAMPETIVVGIVNTKRTRDLTPTESIINYMGEPDTRPDTWMKPSGGNELFLQFIREELMAYVEANYKTTSFKILGGHSFGGLATVNCLLTHPNMFSAYIAISPSFWWDREYALKLAEKNLVKGSAFNKSIFYSDGNEGVSDGSSYHTNLLKFDSLLSRKALTGLEHKYIYYPEETHMTEPVKAYYDALRFIFHDWPVPQQNPKAINTSALMDHYNHKSQKYGYTILPEENNTNDWATYLLLNKETTKSGVSLLEMNARNYPNSFKAFANLGDAYAKIGDKQKAKDCFQKALLLNPKYEEAKAKLKALGK